MIRPRLYGGDAEWQSILKTIRQIGLDSALQTLNNTSSFKYNEKEGTLTSEKGYRIKSKDDLITAAKIDLDEWKIDNYIVNTWEQYSVKNGYKTLYQVKLWLKRKGLDQPDRSFTDKWVKKITDKIKLTSPVLPSDERPYILTIADLHVGHFIKNDELIPDYNVTILREKLRDIARLNVGKRIHLVVLGDLIESFTGKNKGDTWKQIELHGAKAALTAFDLLWEFIQLLGGVEKLYMVSGNHDRISNQRDEDYEGQIAELVAGIFDRATDVDIEFDSLVLNPIIDGIQYIFSHGDFLFRKKQHAQLVLDYGSQHLFNFAVGGHLHKADIVEDKLKFRQMTCPSLLTGTPYEKRNQWNSNSGYLLIKNNGKNKATTLIDII